MLTRRKLLAAMGGAAALPAMSACGVLDDQSTSSSGSKTLRIAFNSNVTALPVWVAQDEGFLKEQGLKAKFTVVENVATMPPALGRSFDVVLSTPTLLISATAQKLPAVQIAGSSIDNEANPSGHVLVPKDSDIKSIKDLKGKKLGVLNETGSLHIATKYWLQKEGVSPDSVQAVQVNGPAQPDQLASGRIDAVETVAPFSTTMLAKGNKSIGIPYRAIAPEVSAIFWIAGKSWAEENAEKVAKFQKALKQGEEFIASDDAGARKIAAKYTKLPPDVVNKIKLPEYDTTVHGDDLDEWLTAMREVNGFKGDVNVKDLVVK
ncbi:MAG: ABC transporter substrate-binding protein [Micromonosporaceae bacterium]